MSEEMTCGKGLAARARLPEAVAALAAAKAEVLSYHQRSLDSSNAEARAEIARYAVLTGRFRTVAEALRSTAELMAGSRDLPMAPHDVAILGTAENTALFERYVDAERNLLAILSDELRENEGMLQSMRGE